MSSCCTSQKLLVSICHVESWCGEQSSSTLQKHPKPAAFKQFLPSSNKRKTIEFFLIASGPSWAYRVWCNMNCELFWYIISHHLPFLFHQYAPRCTTRRSKAQRKFEDLFARRRGRSVNGTEVDRRLEKLEAGPDSSKIAYSKSKTHDFTWHVGRYFGGGLCLCWSRVRSRMRFVGSLTHAFWVRIRRRFASYVAFGYLEARIAVRSHMHAFSHTSYHQRKLGSSYGQIEWWWRVGETLHYITIHHKRIDLDEGWYVAHACVLTCIISYHISHGDT